MKTQFNFIRLAFVAAIIALSIGTTQAQRIASVTGNWNNTATWGGAAVPTSAETVTINQGINVTVNIGTAECASLQICNAASGTATLTFNSGSQLTVSGTVTLGGTTNPRIGVINMASGGTLICNALAIGASGSNLFTYGTGTVQLNATNTLPSTIFTQFNNLIVYGGTTTLTSNLTCASLTVDNTGIFQFNSTTDRTLTVSGAVNLVNGTINTFNASGTNDHTLDIGGNLTMSSGTTLNTTNANNNIAINIAGDWTDNGATFTPGNNTVTFDGTGAQAIKGTAASQTFYDVTLTKTAGTTLTVSGSTTTLTVNNLTETTGNFTAPATLNINASLTLTAGTFTAGTTINISGNWTRDGGTVTPGSSTVNFNNTSVAQNLNGSVASQTFNNIAVAKSGQSLTTGNSVTTLSVASVTLTSGTFNVNNVTALNVSGDWTNNGGTFTPSSSTVNFNSTSAAQNLNGTAASQTFNNVTVAKSAQTLTVGGSTTTLSLANLTLTSGTLDAGTLTTLNVANDWANNSGALAFTAGSSAVNFTHASNAAIGGSASTTFNNLNVALAGGTLTLNSNVNAGNVTFTVNANTLSVSSTKTLTVSGTVTLNSANGANMSCNIQGAGSLSCGSLAAGTASTPTATRSTTMTSTINSLTVTGNLTLTSSRPVSNVNNATFTQSGNTTVTIGGVITPVTGNNAASIATMTLGSGGSTLILTDASPFGTTGNLGLFTTTLTGSGSTVVYSGASQSVLGTNYNNLTIMGTGTKTLASLNISAGSTLSMQGTAICAGVSPTYASATTSSLIYEGTSGAQTTGAELPASMNAPVTINNANGVTLNSSTTTTATVTLTSGKLTTTLAKLLTVTADIGGSGNTTAITGSSASYVSGPLAFNFSTTANYPKNFIFPIGKSGYNPFALSSLVKLAGAGNDMTVRAEVFDANSGGSASTAKYSRVSAINSNRYWQTAVTLNPGVFTSSVISLTESSPAVNADSRVAFCATQSGVYDGLKGITLAGNTITSVLPATALNFFTVGTTSYLTAGTYTVGNSRTYFNLTDVATILDTKTLSGNVIFELQNDYDGTVANVTHPEVIPVTFIPFLTSGGSWTATVRPASGVSMRTTSAPQATGGTTESIIVFDNQVQNIIFDGRAGGSGTTVGWTIRNTYSSGNTGPAIKLINGANHNTFTYLQIESESSASNQGTFLFGNSTVAGGSSFNTVSFCNISARTDVTIVFSGSGSYEPLNAIGCDGNASGNENSSNSILNNNIFNFSKNGIRLGGTGTGNGWIITGNSFYTTYSDPSTTTAINNLAGSTYGGYVIDGNFIGGNGPNCGTAGVPWTITSTGGDFIGIALTTSKTNSSSIQNNTIQNIRLQGTGTATFNGIQIFQGACTIAGNTIGSASVANSIEMAGSGRSVGIYSSALSSTAVVTISNNTIANLSSTGTIRTEILAGIWTDNGSNFITNNTIFNLSSADNNTFSATGGNGAKVSVLGISFIADQPNQTVIGNTIYNLSNTHLTAAVNVIGIYMSPQGAVTNCIVAKNFIHHLSTSSSSPSSQITGISMYYGGDTYKNNMISLGTGLPAGANPVIAGIELVHATTSGSLFYNNSVYIGGTVTPTGAANSYCFNRNVSATNQIVQNNIFINERSNATSGGKHFAFGLNNGTSTITSNYNILNATGSGGAIATLNSGSTSLTLQGLRAGLVIGGVNQDMNSGVGDPNFVNSTGNAASVNLHVQNPTPVESAGLSIAGVTDDFDGQTRSGLSPTDIGADAGSFTALAAGTDIYTPNISYSTLGTQLNCANPVLTATITDVGTGVPAGGARVYYRRLSPVSSWVSNAGTLASGNGNNGTWNFTIDYSLMLISNYAGSTIQYYVVAQDQAANPGNASNPNFWFNRFNATTPAFATYDITVQTTPPGVANSFLISAAAGPSTSHTVTPSTSCGSAVIGLATSESGVNYYLKLSDPVTGTTVDGPIAGGGAISFALQTTGITSSTYYVVGTNANSCPATMTGTSVINFLPAAPVAADGTLPTDVSIRVNWGTVVGATGYFLDISTASDFSSFVTSTDVIPVVYNNLLIPGGGTSFRNVTGLLYNTTYYYRVRSNNNLGCTSVNSNVITMPTCGIRTWGGGTGDWFTASNWSPAFVPNSCDNVVINSGNPTIDGASNSFCNDIAVNGGTLTINSGYSGQLKVSGNLSNGATINTNGNLISLESASGTISGGGNYANAGLIINGTNYSLSNSISSLGNLVVSNARTFDMNDKNLQVSLVTQNGSGSLLQKSGTLTIKDPAATLTDFFDGGSGTTLFNLNDDQTVPSITTYNFLVVQGTSGKTATIGSVGNVGCTSLTIQGAGNVQTISTGSTIVAVDFAITGTVTLTINHPIRNPTSGNFSMGVGNSLVIIKDDAALPTGRALSGFGASLTFAGPVTYSNNNDQYLLAGSYTDLTVNNGTGVRKMADGDVTVSGLLTMTTGLINTVTNKITLTSGAPIALSEPADGSSFVLGKIEITRTITASTTQSFGGLGIDVTQTTTTGGITCTRIIGIDYPIGCANSTTLRSFQFSPTPAVSATVVFHYYDSPYELNGFVENYYIAYKSIDNGVNWIAQTTGAAVNASANTITMNGQTKLGWYTATAPFPLGGSILIQTVPPQLTAIVCPTNSVNITVTGQKGRSYEWQSSTDNINWGPAFGTNNTTTYVATPTDPKTYYRFLAKATECWDVASNSVIIETTPITPLTVTVINSKTTDNSITLDWSPVGVGNFNINYGVGSVSAVSPPKTITGLTENTSYNFTVTQTGVIGACTSSGTASGLTLCAAPAITSTSGSAHAITINWTGGGVTPNGTYRIFYRHLFSATTYASKDFTIGGANGTAIIDKTGNTILNSSSTYEVYIAKVGCPSGTTLGQPSPKGYAKTTPVPSCATPLITLVRSLCPNQLEVFMTNSPTNQYVVYVQRISPTMSSVVSYTVSSNYLSVNVGTHDATYLVGVASKCLSGLSELDLRTQYVKALCSPPANVVLSNPKCNGFTASWNIDPCGLNAVGSYNLYMQQIGPTVTGWNSYRIYPPISPVSPYLKVNWLNRGVTLRVYVQSIYVCSGFSVLGPVSNMETITTLSTSCRDEEEELTPEEQPIVETGSTDSRHILSLYPNPNSGQFMLEISQLTNDEQQVKIEVINLIGQTVTTHFTTASGGHLTEIINLPETISGGTYFVRATAGNDVYTAKVNISR